MDWDSCAGIYVLGNGDFVLKIQMIIKINEFPGKRSPPQNSTGIFGYQWSNQSRKRASAVALRPSQPSQYQQNTSPIQNWVSDALFRV